MSRIPDDLKGNSIAFLRFFLAGLVVFSHSFPLGGFGQEPLTSLGSGQSFGGIAVGGFFFLSGLLITRSYIKTDSFMRYLWHRFLRIFPAFWCCLLITAAVFGPIACLKEHVSLSDYLTGPQGAMHYIYANAFLSMRQYPISGLLRHNPYQGAFDGSLWTLAIEFQCYLGIAMLGLCAVLTRRPRVVVALTAGVVMLIAGLNILSHIEHGARISAYASEAEGYFALWSYFLIGASVYLFRRRIPLDLRLFGLSSGLTLLSLHVPILGGLLLPFSLSYCLLWLTFRLPIRTFDARGDFSYGLYIFAFPIQQLFALFGLTRSGFVPYFLASIALTLALAVLSWNFIEKPALSLKSASVPIWLVNWRHKVLWQGIGRV